MICLYFHWLISNSGEKICIPRQVHIYESREKPSRGDLFNVQKNMTAYRFHGSSKLQSPNRCTSQQWCEIEISIGRNDNNIWSENSWGHRKFLESQKTRTYTHHIALCQSPEVTHNHPIQNQVSLHAVFGWRPLSSNGVRHHARGLRCVRTGYSDLSSFVWGSSVSTSTLWGTFPSTRLISGRLIASLFMYSIWCHRTSVRWLEFI